MHKMRYFCFFILLALAANFGNNANAQGTRRTFNLNAFQAPKVIEYVTDYSIYVALLDTHRSASERQISFANIQARADAGDPTAQYFIGSLYRLGGKLHASPFPQDLDKARLYLGNAATHGHIYAMAKMAEIELDDGHYREAMNWAQIYAHYSILLHVQYNSAYQNFLSDLLVRISKGFDKAAYQAVVDDLNIFISNYDVTIRSGVEVNRQMRVNALSPYLQIDSNHFRVAPAGFADFLVVFRPDGSVANAWLFDGTPDLSVGYTLSQEITEIKAPVLQDTKLRYAWLAYAWNNRKCQKCENNYKREMH